MLVFLVLAPVSTAYKMNYPKILRDSRESLNMQMQKILSHFNLNIKEVTRVASINGYGTLTCKGIIQIDYSIVLSIIIDTVFPYDCNSGGLFFGTLWPYTVYGDDQATLDDWYGVGEHHIWCLKIIIKNDLTVFQHIIDGVIVYDQTREFGKDYIQDGSHDITGAFVSYNEDSYIGVTTEPFRLVKENNIFRLE